MPKYNLNASQIPAKYRWVIVIAVALAVTSFNIFPDIRDIYRAHQLSHYAAASNHEFVNRYGPTPDNHTYNIAVPDDFHELSSKEAPDHNGFVKKYKTTSLAGIELRAYQLNDDELTGTQLELDNYKKNGDKYVSELKTSTDSFNNVSFDDHFTEPSKGHYTIHFRSQQFSNDDLEFSGTLVLTLRDNYLYRLIVTSKHVYDKNIPDFQKTVTGGFSIK